MLRSMKQEMTTSSKVNKPSILFVLSVDTEEEWDWSGPFPKGNFSVKNTRHIPKFQRFCERLGIRPTYFVDYAIADDAESVKHLKAHLDTGNCEIGGHLHPWCNPPIEEDVSNTDFSRTVNLPIDLVERKLDNLNRKLESVFGKKPCSFRSGRWDTNGPLLKLVASKGYTIDSSIHPYFSYHEAPDSPFWPDYETCSMQGDQRDIYEIPVTAGYNFPDFPFWNWLHLALSTSFLKYFRPVGILWKLHIMRKIQLSPELADASNMITLVKAALKRGHRVIHMYFHSSSLLPGGSPYVKNSDDEKKLYSNIERVFRYLQENTDMQCCTLEEAYQIIKK